MNRAAFFRVVRPYMPGGKMLPKQVARIEAVLDFMENRPVLSLEKKAYILGTAHHETDAWRTLSEYASGAAYEGREDLGNTKRGDGVRFKGRGFVQITGRKNYTDWAKRLGVDIVTNPLLASMPKNAALILVDGMTLGTFTGYKLADYFTRDKADWLYARRIVNKLDKALLIAGHAKLFLRALQAAT
jgi:hypothetical protein